MAGGKHKAACLKAYVVFADESGVLLLPPVLKTWAPRGCTPLLRHRTRRDKVSVISGISVSPQRRHVGLYYDFHRHNIRHQEVYAFLRQLLRHLRGHIVVLLDNARIHRGALHALCARHPRLHLEYFPAYAPELNPDEGVWTLTKRALANGRPDTLDDLLADLVLSIENVRAAPHLLRSCITHSDLPPFSCPGRCIRYAALNNNTLSRLPAVSSSGLWGRISTGRGPSHRARLRWICVERAERAPRFRLNPELVHDPLLCEGRSAADCADLIA